MIVSQTLKKNKELFENEEKEKKFAKKYQILSKSTALFSNIVNNDKISENLNLIKIDIKNMENNIKKTINQMNMNQNTIGMNTMMTNQNTMGMNPMMMNQNAMGMNTMGMNPMMNMMNCPFIDMQEFWIYQEKDNIIKQNEVLNNLINKYELKKNDILTIEKIIQNNMKHLQNCIEKKNDNNYLFSLSNISMGRIFSSLENKYIDLDLKELINSQNML